MPDFATRLRALGIKGPELRRWAERTSGLAVARSTIPRWLRGDRQPDPWAVALLATAERHPAVLAEIKGE